MNKEEFLIYCLLYAVDAADVKKQNLVQMALKADVVDFVKIYNFIQQQGETERKSLIAEMLNDFDRDTLIKEIADIFLTDIEYELRESVVKSLEDNF